MQQVVGWYYTIYNVYQAITGKNNVMKAEDLGSFTFDKAMEMIEANSLELV